MWRICLLLLFSGSANAQSISDELKSRTGYPLRENLSQTPATFTLPPGVTLTDRVLARDAVAIALWNNSALEANLASLELSRADLVEAGLFRNPSFSLLFPVGPKPFEFLFTWPIEEFFQRRKRIKVAEASIAAAASGLVQNGLDLIRDVRIAHVDLWLAQERTQTLAQSSDLRARIAVLTERRRNDGDASGLDVALSRSDAEAMRQLANRSERDVEITLTLIRRLLGLRGDTRTFLAALDDVEPRVSQDLPSLVEMAIGNRPDLRAAELDVETSAARAKWQRSRLLAMIAPALSIKEVGTFGTRTGPGLNADVPLLNRNEGQISRADAEVLRAGRLYVSLKDRVEHEVAEAYGKVIQAQASLAQIRERVLPSVNESVRLTERAFQNGDVSLLNVLESSRQRFDVVLAELDARATLHRAFAELERAIGRSL